MSEQKIFGSLYADTYDAVYRDKNYAAECDILERLFEQSGKIKSVLDLGCGTGNHAAELSKRGYEIVGLDQSEQMLTIARAKQLASCEFVKADIRQFELNRKFDAVVLMFNVVGYITKQADLNAVFQSAHHHLNPGGFLVFDFWYAPAIRQDPPRESHREISLADQTVNRASAGELIPTANQILVTCQITHGDQKSAEVHLVRFFELDELQETLSATGFNEIRFGSFSNPAIPPNADEWAAISWCRD